MPVNKRALGASGMHKICATDSAGAPLTQFADARRHPLADGRGAPTSGAGSPRAMPKGGALLRRTVYNINWINWLVIGSGVDPWHYPFWSRPAPFTEA